MFLPVCRLGTAINQWCDYSNKIFLALKKWVLTNVRPHFQPEANALPFAPVLFESIGPLFLHAKLIYHEIAVCYTLYLYPLCGWLQPRFKSILLTFFPCQGISVKAIHRAVAFWFPLFKLFQWSYLPLSSSFDSGVCVCVCLWVEGGG